MAGAGSKAAGAPGAGRGGPGDGLGGGTGMGERPEAKDGASQTQLERLSGARHRGEIAGSYLVEGEAPKGAAAIELREAALAGQRFAEESLDQERIPADLREIPRRYFERIQE
ncbi:MAG: hypothetical protein L0Z55_11385 [Planctomycetes bacterium]|nr:hypothetical protein [Planctomycetota bacterium]